MMDKLVEVSDQEVKLEFSLNCKCRATVIIRSLVASCSVAFKVQTSSPQKYLVNPPSGIVPPLSYATFQLILKPQSTLPSHFPRSPSDRFLIKTALVPDQYQPRNSGETSTVHSQILVPSLFRNSHDIRISVAFVGPTLLRHAVNIGDVNAVRKILKRQRSILAEMPGPIAVSIFQLAFELDNSADMVNILTKAGLKTDYIVYKGRNQHSAQGVGSSASADDEICNLNGWKELHVAAMYDRADEIGLLIKQGVMLDCKDREGRTPLMLAAVKGYDVSVRMLVGAGADMNARGKDGKTGLYNAAVTGDRKMVEVLMELGADPAVGAMDHGRSALDVARYKGYNEVVRILEQGETLLNAARRGDTIHLERLLKQGASTTWCDQYGLTSLHIAAIKGQTDSVTLLLEFRSELECCDNEGHTPLHLAVEGGHIETVEVLINKGANLNAKSKKGTVPLYIANVMGYDDICQFLYQRGACTNSSLPSTSSCSM